MRRADRLVEDRERLRAMLEKADACRLGFAQGDMPYIVTLNFGFEWEGELPVLFFHCAREGRKLEMMRRNPRVCFELDLEHELIVAPTACGWGMKFASIVGYGSLSEVSDEEGRREGLGLIMRRYGWKDDSGFEPGPMRAAMVLRLEASELCGKRKG
jgi:uncharacterized protein